MVDDQEPEEVWEPPSSNSAPTISDAREKRCPKCGRRYAGVAEVCASDGASLVAARRVPADCFIGNTIHDRYAIEAILGTGGMGTVYEAIHTGLHKRFAVKILRPDIAFDRVTVERFIQEARIAASLKHANLVDVSDFGEVSADDVPEVAGRRVPFFVMELLRGDTVADLIRDRGSLDVGLATEILRQAAAGLAVAHAAGVVHRDLKPDNIFVIHGPEGPVVKVLDFGIAKVAASAARLTRPNVVFGTPAYMSPEQAVGGVVDARADLYSLAVVMYEALTGRAPFEADADVIASGKRRFDPPPPIDHLGGVGPVVMRCLENDPDARFQSANDILAALLPLP